MKRASLVQVAPRLAAFFIILLLPVIAIAQTANIHFEALSGTHAPGTQPGFTWFSFGGGAISDDGEITFRAFIDRNDGGTDQIGLWRGSGGNFTLVTRSDDTAPGAGTGAIFDEPFAPAYRAANGVAPKPLAFYATVNTGPDILPSFWSLANGSLTKIAMKGDPAPGGQTYERFFERDFCVADDGSPVITGQAGGGLGTIWYVANGTVSMAVQDGQPVPGLSQGTFSVGTQPVVAVSGGADPRIAFYAGIVNGPLVRPGVGRGWGLFTQRFGQAPVAARMQADNTTSIPGAYYNQLTDFDINANELIAYRATLAAIDPMQFPSPVNDSNDEGVFLGDSLLVRKGEPSPRSGLTFIGFDDVVINKAGNVAFQGYVTDSADNVSGTICLVDGSDRFVIAAIGDQVPGAPDGVTFASFANIAQGRLQLNNRGQVVFLASDSEGKSGLWGGDRDGNLQRIVRVGDQVEIARNDVRTITGFNYLNRLTVGSGGSDGHARALNDSGQVVFSVTFSDGTSGMGFANVDGGNVAPGGDSSGNFAESITDGDPVNTRSGELLDYAIDLDLRGPMALRFGRYYAARLASDGKLASALGPNWLSNLDAKLTVTGDTAEVVTNDGRVMLFTRSSSALKRSTSSNAFPAPDNGWTLTAPLDIPFQLAENGSTFVLADPRSQRLHTFDAEGRLTKIEDGHGNAHTLTYDGNGRLANVSDGLGRTLTLTYDAGGKLMTVSDGNRSVQYVHDADGNLVSVTDPLNRTTSYSYAAGGLLSSTVLPRGNAPVTQTFASSKVVSQVEHPAMGITQTSSFAYDAAAHTTTITDPTGKSRVHGYSSDGALSSFGDEEGGMITLRPDPTGRRSEVTDQLGNATSISFHSPSGRPERILNAEGASATFSYAARKVGGITFYDLVKTVRADGSVRTFTYDAKGNVLTATDPLGKKTTYSYNARGQLTSATDPTGAVLTYSYDDATGNLKASKGSDTGETTYTCDAVQPAHTPHPSRRNSPGRGLRPSRPRYPNHRRAWANHDIFL
jgi:YD repeat-containing protein